MLGARRVGRFGLLLVALLGAAGVAGAEQGRVILGRYGAFELAIGKAFHSDEGIEYPFEILLMDKSGRVVGAAKLEVSSSSRKWERESLERFSAADPSSQVFGTGAEAFGVSVAVARVRLAAGKTGLLVTEQFGFEHVKRWHALFAEVAGRLRRVWTGQEGAGPAWSAVRLIRSGKARVDDIAYSAGFDYPPDDEFAEQGDRFVIKRLHWDGATKKVRESDLPDVAAPLYVLKGDGVYANPGEARKAMEGSSGCLSGFSAFRGETFPGLVDGKAFVGSAFVRKADAERVMRYVLAREECSRGLGMTIVEYRKGGAVGR